MQNSINPRETSIRTIQTEHKKGMSDYDICRTYGIPMPLIRKTIINYELEHHIIEME